MESTELQVNLTSQEDIRAKLPEARRMYEAKVEALEALRQDVDNWGKLVDLLAQLAGEMGAEPLAPRSGALPLSGLPLSGGRRLVIDPVLGGRESPAQDRAIAALQQAGRPMGPTALYRYMKSQDLQPPKNANALGAALWNAMTHGRLKKTPEGYALPDWQDDQPESNDAAQDGSTSQGEPSHIGKRDQEQVPVAGNSDRSQMGYTKVGYEDEKQA
jgi:hypothetical protein